MGGWISWQEAAVERDPRPGEALHVGHVGVVIKVRPVLGILLENTEYTGRGLAPFPPTRDRRPQDRALSVVNRDSLVAQRDDRHDRLAGRARLDRLDRTVAPAACSARRI